MHLTNDIVLYHLNEKENNKKINIINTIQMACNEEMTDDDCLNLYKKLISIHQTHIKRSGICFEMLICHHLEQNNIPFKEQVKINNEGYIIGFRGSNTNLNQRTFKILDVLVGENIDVGSHISNYIYLEIKKSCKERWYNIQFTLNENTKPIHTYLCCMHDYPCKENFILNENRSIVSTYRKKNDSESDILFFDDLIQDIKKKINRI